MAKIFVYWIACIIITLIYQSVDMIGMTCLFGFGLKGSFYELILLIKTEMVYLIIMSGLVSISILAAFAFKSLFAVTATEIVWIMFGSPIFQNLASVSEVIGHLYSNSIFGIMAAFTLPLYVNEDGFRSLESVPVNDILEILKDQRYTKYLLISLITVLVTITVSYYIFKETELK